MKTIIIYDFGRNIWLDVTMPNVFVLDIMA